MDDRSNHTWFSMSLQAPEYVHRHIWRAVLFLIIIVVLVRHGAVIGFSI